MASRKTKFFVGLFVLIGFTFTTILIIWLGLSNYFESGRYYAAYFDESVQGLSKDSPVKYRGVSVGRVAELEVAPDAELIEVILKIETGWKPGENTIAQLNAVGITGIMYIELDLAKEEPKLSPKIDFEPVYPIIPTKPSDIQTLFSGLEDTLKKIQNFDVQTISNKLKQALTTLNQTLEDAQIESLSSDIRSLLSEAEKIVKAQNWERLLTTLENTGDSVQETAESAEMMVSEIKQTINRIDRIISGNEKEIESIITELNSAATSADKMMERGNNLLGQAENSLGSLQNRLAVALQRLENTMQNLNDFVDRLSDQPSRLIFGTPPQERKDIR